MGDEYRISQAPIKGRNSRARHTLRLWNRLEPRSAWMGEDGGSTIGSSSDCGEVLIRRRVRQRLPGRAGPWPGTLKWFREYNEQRPHQSLDLECPGDVYGDPQAHGARARTRRMKPAQRTARSRRPALRSPLRAGRRERNLASSAREKRQTIQQQRQTPNHNLISTEIGPTVGVRLSFQMVNPRLFAYTHPRLCAALLFWLTIC